MNRFCELYGTSMLCVHIEVNWLTMVIAWRCMMLTLTHLIQHMNELKRTNNTCDKMAYYHNWTLLYAFS